MTRTAVLHHHVNPHVPDLPKPTSRDWIKHAVGNPDIRGMFDNLHEWPVSDTCEPKVTVLEEPRSIAPPDLSIFEGTKVSTIGLTNKKTNGIKLLEFTDVYIVVETSGFVLLDKNGVSNWSNGLPKFRKASLEDAIEMPATFLASDRFSSYNISHFTYDHVGRAILAQELCNFHNEDIAFTESATAYSRYVQAKVFPGSWSLQVGAVYHFEKLFMLYDSVWYLTHPASFCDDRIMRRLRASLMPPRKRFGKLFVSRKDVSYRRELANEDALARYLEDRGYYSVVPSEYSPQLQLEMFAGAESIVSPHGAALTSLIVTAPGTPVHELFSPEEGTAAYMLIAQALGLDYAAHMGVTEGGAHRLRWGFPADRFTEMA